ncbi:hypothetical protein SAMN04488026_10053 [Aliiruegeria lutimaris]|uniref:Uncharacterized protein n=1 Tax=Aliiruegeria lutimaris TaxID=571298 RepID=A0A1G8M283_9RHOB|nr:hypothetical protein SAMN04488026_10053 [Aliiruegeria lutimaris]
MTEFLEGRQPFRRPEDGANESLDPAVIDSIGARDHAGIFSSNMAAIRPTQARAE